KKRFFLKRNLEAVYQICQNKWHKKLGCRRSKTYSLWLMQMYLDKSLNDIQKPTKHGVFVVALEGLNIVLYQLDDRLTNSNTIYFAKLEMNTENSLIRHPFSVKTYASPIC